MKGQFPGVGQVRGNWQGLARPRDPGGTRREGVRGTRGLPGGRCGLGEGPAGQEWPENRHQRLCPLAPMAHLSPLPSEFWRAGGTSGRAQSVTLAPSAEQSRVAGEEAALQRPWHGVRGLDPGCADGFINQTRQRELKQTCWSPAAGRV